jgi:hypothetical protein
MILFTMKTEFKMDIIWVRLIFFLKNVLFSCDVVMISLLRRIACMCREW